MLLFLLACQSATPSKATTADYHLLWSGQGPYKDDGYPGIWETDLDFNEVWALDLPGEQGGFGALREGTDTLIARTTQPPDPNVSVERVTADGSVVWAYDADTAGMLVFPHGIALTPWEQYVIADVFTSRIFAVSADGRLDWSNYTREAGGAPSGFDIGMVDGKPMLIATLLDESVMGDDSNNRIAAWWLEKDGLTPAWTWPESGDKHNASWLHGAHFQYDGSLLVSVAGVGQVVQLDPVTGLELDRIPRDGKGMLAFPRDAVLLPNGDMILADALELVRVRDPFGDFERVASTALPLTYSVELIDCATQTCY